MALMISKVVLLHQYSNGHHEERDFFKIHELKQNYCPFILIPHLNLFREKKKKQRITRSEVEVQSERLSQTGTPFSF